MVENNELKLALDALVAELSTHLNITEQEVKVKLLELLLESFKNN